MHKASPFFVLCLSLSDVILQTASNRYKSANLHLVQESDHVQDQTSNKILYMLRFTR